MASAALFPKVFIVVDALDKCFDQHLVAKQLKAISALTNTHVICFSRRERRLELGIQDIVQEIPLTSEHVDKDIAMYVKHKIETSGEISFWSVEDKEKVQNYLTSKAAGM